MADARRLAELGMAPELAKEIAAQIGAAAGAGAVTSVNGQTGAVVITAADVIYDNTTSGMAAEDVQAAIDELDAAP